MKWLILPVLIIALLAIYTFWDIIFTLLMIPVSIIAFFILAVIILALYYYIEAWLSGNVYARNIPEPSVFSPATRAVLGLDAEGQGGKDTKEGGVNASGDAFASGSSEEYPAGSDNGEDEND